MPINNMICPKCGSSNSIKIVYGLPIYEAGLKAQEGKIKLGGCCITGDNPEYFCKDCKNEWNRQKDGENLNFNKIKRK